jgi:AraC-like DNA-binding protein
VGDKTSTTRPDIDGEGFAARAPHPRLARHVIAYTGHDRVHARPLLRRVTALGSVTVAIDFDTPVRRLAGGPPGPPWRPRAAASPVSGLSDRPMVFEQQGRERGIALELTPLGAYALFGLPMRELANISVDAADLLGPRIRLLAEQLAETPGWEARFQLLDDRLAAWMREGPDLARPVLGAWQRLVTTSGWTRISALADDVGWTLPHLQSRFRDQIGLTPKTTARILRLHRVIRLMTEPNPPRWSDVAVACGYADQPHLNRDVRALTGCAPTELLSLSHPCGEIFMGAQFVRQLSTIPTRHDRAEDHEQQPSRPGTP